MADAGNTGHAAYDVEIDARGEIRPQDLTGTALRDTLLLVSGRIDELNHDFHPKSAKEELKEELEDLAVRQDHEKGVQS